MAKFKLTAYAYVGEDLQESNTWTYEGVDLDTAVENFRECCYQECTPCDDLVIEELD